MKSKIKILKEKLNVSKEKPKNVFIDFVLIDMAIGEFKSSNLNEYKKIQKQEKRLKEISGYDLNDVFYYGLNEVFSTDKKSLKFFENGYSPDGIGNLRNVEHIFKKFKNVFRVKFGDDSLAYLILSEMFNDVRVFGNFLYFFYLFF